MSKKPSITLSKRFSRANYWKIMGTSRIKITIIFPFKIQFRWRKRKKENAASDGIKGGGENYHVKKKRWCIQCCVCEKEIMCNFKFYQNFNP